MKRTVVACLIGAAMSLAGCGGSNDGSQAVGCSAFTSALTILGPDGPQSSFAPGATVTLQLQITNTSAYAQTVTEVAGCYTPDIFYIDDSAGQEIYYTEQNCYTIASQSYTYQPGQTQTFTVQWQQTENQTSTAAPAGDYTVYGQYSTEQCPTLTSSAGLEIQ
jgi:hypothetical protein